MIVSYCCQQWAKEVNGSHIWQTAISPAQYTQYTFVFAADYNCVCVVGK
jgi:hypothetical protein